MSFELLCLFFCGLWSLSLSCCVLPFVMRSFCVDTLFCVPVSRIFLLQVLPLWLQACWGVCIVVHRVLQLLIVQVHLGVCVPVRHVLLLLWVQVHLSVCIPVRHVLLLLWVQVHLSVCVPGHHVLLLWVQVHLCLYSWTPCSASLSAGPPVSVFLYAMFYFSEYRSTCVCIPVCHVLLLWVQVHLCLYSWTPCSTSLSAGPPVSVFLCAMFCCFCVCVPVHLVQTLLLWLQADRSICVPGWQEHLCFEFVLHVVLLQALLLRLCFCTPSFASVDAGWQEHCVPAHHVLLLRLRFCGCVPVRRVLLVQALLLWSQVDGSVLLLPAGSICIPARRVLLVQALLLWLQVDGSVCVPVCHVLLLQALQHVGHAAEHGVLWLHRPHLLRLLPHARHRLLLCLPQVCPIHLREPQDGLDSLSLVLHCGLLFLVGVGKDGGARSCNCESL